MSEVEEEEKEPEKDRKGKDEGGGRGGGWGGNRMCGGKSGRRERREDEEVHELYLTSDFLDSICVWKPVRTILNLSTKWEGLEVELT